MEKYPGTTGWESYGSLCISQKARRRDRTTSDQRKKPQSLAAYLKRVEEAAFSVLCRKPIFSLKVRKHPHKGNRPQERIFRTSLIAKDREEKLLHE
ncbi:hypothetical protein BJP46_26670 [Paenibacillus odorifer]|nr:hypothetical protein BJP46_26670 [Paenibacillus odorifer]